MTAHDAAHESNTDDTDEGVDADTTSAEVGAEVEAGLEVDDVVGTAMADDLLDDDAAAFESDFYDDFDESDLEGPSNMGAPPVSSARKGAVATAFLGAGLALEQIIYGVERSVPAVVQEASEPDPDADLVVHLDKDDPKKSWARLRDEP